MLSTWLEAAMNNQQSNQITEQKSQPLLNEKAKTLIFALKAWSVLTLLHISYLLLKGWLS